MKAFFEKADAKGGKKGNWESRGIYRSLFSFLPILLPPFCCVLFCRLSCDMVDRYWFFQQVFVQKDLRIKIGLVRKFEVGTSYIFYFERFYDDFHITSYTFTINIAGCVTFWLFLVNMIQSHCQFNKTPFWSMDSYLHARELKKFLRWLINRKGGWWGCKLRSKWYFESIKLKFSIKINVNKFHSNRLRGKVIRGK